MTILPKSKLGKWSFGLMIPFVAGLGVFFLMANVFHKTGVNPWLITPMLIAVLGAAASFITGMISFFASRERALLVFVSVVIGLAVTAFAVMMLSFPE